jgi:hypothetical protein
MGTELKSEWAIVILILQPVQHAIMKILQPLKKYSLFKHQMFHDAKSLENTTSSLALAANSKEFVLANQHIYVQRLAKSNINKSKKEGLPFLFRRITILK